MGTEKVHRGYFLIFRKEPKYVKCRMFAFYHRLIQCPTLIYRNPVMKWVVASVFMFIF